MPLLAHGKRTLADLESNLPEVNRRTLQRDLKAMVDKGLIREVATGPTDPNRQHVLGSCDQAMTWSCDML